MTDQITEIVESLPREALVAGVKAVESELDIGEEAISCPRYAIKPIFDAAQRIASKRNELAHSTVMKMDDSHWSRLHLRDHAQPQRPITEDYLQSMIDPTWADLSASLDNYENLCTQLGVSPQIWV